MPICASCKDYKPVSEMTVSRQTMRGHGSYCKACHNTKRKAKMTYAIARENYLRSRYGIGIADYDAMYAAQDGKCAICGHGQAPRIMGRKSKVYTTLMIDHCHTTKKIRELLCTQCNVAIGYFAELPERLHRAVAYLEKHAEN